MSKNNLTDIQNQVVEVKADQINIRTDNLTKKYFNEIIEGATVTDRFNNLLKVYKEWKESREDFSLNEPINVIKQNLQCILGALEQAEMQGQTWADSTNRNVDFIGEELEQFRNELKEHNELSIRVEELKQQLEKAIEKGTEARNNLGQASEKIIILEKENKELMKENKSLMEDKLKVSELRNRILELEKLNTEHKVAYGELMLDFSKLGTEKEQLEKDIKALEENYKKEINRLNSELEKIKKAQNNKNK